VIRMIKRLSGAAALCAAVLAVPAATAAADSGPMNIEISNNAAVQLDGSGTLTITYTCLPGFGSGPQGGFWVDVEQTQGFGQVSQNAICDDRDHTTTIAVGPGPFLPGDAFVSVTLGNGLNEGFTQQAEVTFQTAASGKAAGQKAATARDIAVCAKPTGKKTRGQAKTKLCKSTSVHKKAARK
jgi:hypothetical protein